MNLHIELSLSERQVRGACRRMGCADPGDAMRELANRVREETCQALDAAADAQDADRDAPTPVAHDPVVTPEPAPAPRRRAKPARRKASRR